MNIEEYKIKAHEGAAKAQCALGIFYFKGENGVQKDYKQACYWLEKASEQGYAFADYRLGICYLEGKGVDVDRDKAMGYINRAADKGDEDAQHFLRMLKHGNSGMINTDDDPYRTERIRKERQQKQHQKLDKRFWFREVKINAMLILIAVVMTGIATVAFIILFGDRWDTNVMDRRTLYVVAGSFCFSCFVLITGRYFTKFIHKLYKATRRH